MDREETIKLLNENIEEFDINFIHKLIVDYLTEKNIKLDRILLFIKTISSNPIFIVQNTLGRCIEYIIDYYVSKFNINSIVCNNKVIYYF